MADISQLKPRFKGFIKKSLFILILHGHYVFYFLFVQQATRSRGEGTVKLIWITFLGIFIVKISLMSIFVYAASSLQRLKSTSLFIGSLTSL